MSRHRNVRNLTEDDYYDYDEDYYDDDYYEEDDDTAEQYSYQASRPTQFAVPATTTKSSSQVQNFDTRRENQSENGSEEKKRLLEGMGFSSEQAKRALSAVDNDTERAVELLLTGGLEPSQVEPGSVSAPSTVKQGIAKPPPGFMAPPKSAGAAASVVVATPTKPPSTTKGPSPSALFASPITRQKEMKTPPTSYTSTPKLIPNSTSMATPPPKQILPAHIANAISKQRSRLAMVVLGHVDAGKSTLMGQVLVQLGQVQKRTIAKYQKQAADVGKASFALAWVMDEDDSERERGVTMEVATKYITTPKHDFVLLDAPGHAEFIPAMITGAASADVGLLVVAATIGEFEAGFNSANSSNSKSGGQTKEHVVLARGLGVSQIIVAINKLDAVDWSQHRFEEIRAKLQPFLQANGFAPKRTRFIPISGLTGCNIKGRPTEEKLKSWYSGPTLLEAMDNFIPAQRNVDKPLRAIVTDVYAEGKGITTKCRVVQGLVKTGDKVAVLPIGDGAVLTRIDHGLLADAATDRLSWAMAGDTVDLVLGGLDIARIAPGCVLSPSHLSLRPAVRQKMQAKILVMEDLAVPLIRGAQVLWHMHSLDVPAVVSTLMYIIKRDGTQKDRPRALTGGASAVVEITLSEKVCLETYADCRALGRFVLRRGGDTIAVGMIEGVLP